MPNITWTAIDGGDLLDARGEGRLSDLVPAKGGIYIWRRKFVAPPSCKSNGEQFREWILELAGQANARLGRRSLSHCVWTSGIDIGGGGLTAEKQSTLKEISSNARLRQLVISYVESLSDFTPAVYIGNADDLRKRVNLHLDGETGLLYYVEELLRLRWQDLVFQYFVTTKAIAVSDESKAIQELLEMFAQRALAPFGTERPG